MGFSLDDVNPFKEGGVLGPQHPVAGQEPGTDPDSLLSDRRAAQHRQDFLYGGSPTGAADFNAQTQGIASGYGGALSNAGTQASNNLMQTGGAYGNELANQGQGTYGQGQALIGAGQNTLASGNQDAYLDMGSLGRSRASADNMSGAAAGAESAAGSLMGMNFSGPSAAEAQLNAGAQQTAAQNLSLAQSGRGMGGSSAARRQAMTQNSQVMGQMNAQDAVLRANETATQNAQKMQATQAAGGLYGTAGGIYGGAAGVDTSNLGTIAGARGAATGQTNQLGLGQEGLGVQALGTGQSGVAAGANAELGAMSNAGNLALGGLGQGANVELQGQNLQGQTNTTALQGTEGYENDMLGRRGQSINAQTTNQQNQQQNQAGLVGMAGQFIGAGVGALASDANVKTDIEPAEVTSGSSSGGAGAYSTGKGVGGGVLDFLNSGGDPKEATVIGKMGKAFSTSDRTSKTDVQRVPVDGSVFGDTGNQPSDADHFKSQLAKFKSNMGEENKPLEESASKRMLRSMMTGQPMQYHQIGSPSVTQQYQAPLTGMGAGEAASAASRSAGQPRTATPYGGPSEQQYQAEQAQDTIRNAPAYSYRYKDPERHGDGQRVGVMAQDLEKTPAGAAAVMRSPDGTRMVDTGELSTINTAALHGQQSQLDQQSQQIADLRKQLGLPDVDTDALDASYQREASYR